MKNDIELLDALRGKNWIVQGAGFKNENTFTAKCTNERLLATYIPWESALFCPSLDDSEMYWLATRKEAHWELIEN
jgi:hypothetical protein